jgi:hypothetical protein
MAKILIYKLHPDDVRTFVHVATPAQLETILGGFGYPCITNVTDNLKINSFGDNTIEGSNSYNYRDNKVNTVDYSRSNYVRVFS